jgi:hypothetical protein
VPEICYLRSVLFFIQDERTPALLTGRKVQNVSSCRSSRPIDGQRCSVRFGLKVTYICHRSNSGTLDGPLLRPEEFALKKCY